MAHFAKLDENNVVMEVNVVSNEVVNNLPFPDSEALGIAFLTDWSGGYTNWKQTSYSRSFRKNFAGSGMTYRSDIDAFVYPQPFPSWVLDADALWQAPIPYPNDGKLYGWNEATQSWVEDTGA
jgi:hypothetical protein